MNAIKRIAISLNATVDQFLCQVENHEAVAESSIREAEKSALKARVQFRRIQINHQKAVKRIEELKAGKDTWRERAKKLSKEDEEGALECVRRLKLADNEMQQLQEQVRQYADIEAQLGGDLRHVDKKLNELRMKRNLLASRAAKSEAVQAIERVTNDAGVQVEGVFDRWESQIDGEDYLAGAGTGMNNDAFEAKLRNEEEREALKKELQALVEENK